MESHSKTALLLSVHRLETGLNVNSLWGNVDILQKQNISIITNNLCQLLHL